MKKTIISILFAVSGVAAKAQLAATTLNENFNSNCPAGGTHPNGWLDFNTYPSTVPDGTWKCTPSEGRGATGGIRCTNYWAGTFHLNEAFLISPRLNFKTYLGDSIYIRFDARTDKIQKGGRMSVVATTDADTTIQSTSIELATVVPFASPGDTASDWNTYSINMTPYESFNNFSIAFRYFGTDTSGSTWFLDNIYTTKAPLVVSTIPSTRFTLSATGSTASGALTIVYQVMTQEPFMLSVYDLMGRELHSKNFTPVDRSGTYVADGLNLAPGLYLVRMSNGNASRVARAYVE